MAWVKVKRMKVTSDEPSVILKTDKIIFNAVLIKIAEIEKYPFVRIFVDEDLRKIGFEFLKEQEDVDLFKVSKAGSGGYACASRDILDKNWVKKVAANNQINTCVAKKDGRLWVVSLVPSFEYSVKREDTDKIPTSGYGIYRYINSNNEVVYIGKGNIRTRAAEKKREEWIFNKIEYSFIEDDTQSYEWESFWLDNFKNENNGELPRYNLISGRYIEE